MDINTVDFETSKALYTLELLLQNDFDITDADEEDFDSLEGTLVMLQERKDAVQALYEKARDKWENARTDVFQPQNKNK